MQSNIDRKGRRARLISGMICLLAGAALLLFAWMSQATSRTPLAFGMALLGFGLFQIFESRKGWCIVRALGFKTRM